MTPLTREEAERILALPMQHNDADASTIRDYLKALLLQLLLEGEGFSGKRPFGNSGWEHDLHKPLITAGLVEGALDEHGYIRRGYKSQMGEQLIQQATTWL